VTAFGLQWEKSIVLIMILAPSGLAQSIEATVGSIYGAKGRTDWMLRWEFFSGIAVTMAVIVGLQWGIVGVTIAYAATLPLTYPSFAIAFRLIKLSMYAFGQALLRPFVCSLIMFFIILGAKMSLPGLQSEWTLGLIIPLGIITYLLSNLILNRDQIREILELTGIRA
jgi:PST family polysaccharide transporter